jgi:hypothetical protein
VCGQEILGAWMDGVLCRQNDNYKMYDFSFREQNDQGFPTFLQNIAIPILCVHVFTGISTSYMDLTVTSESRMKLRLDDTGAEGYPIGSDHVFTKAIDEYFYIKILLSNDTLRIFGG